MDLSNEKTKLERLLNKNGDLRSLIPLLLESKLFYDRLRKTIDKWEMFKNILTDIGIKTGDALEIYELLKETPDK